MDIFAVRIPEGLDITSALQLGINPVASYCVEDFVEMIHHNCH